MKKRQMAKLTHIMKQLASQPGVDPAMLQEKLLQLKQIEP
jgi:hypothetical protein